MGRTALLVLGVWLLAGCLEVEQHPRWEASSGTSRAGSGNYAGKPDQLPHQAHFHGDRMAWNAAITDRTLLQDEHRRTRP